MMNKSLYRNSSKCPALRLHYFSHDNGIGWRIMKIIMIPIVSEVPDAFGKTAYSFPGSSGTSQILFRDRLCPCESGMDGNRLFVLVQ